jgi:hypothetical protein
MKIIMGLGAAVLALALTGTGAMAQGGASTAGPSPTAGIGNHLPQGTMTQEDFNKLGDYANMSKRLTEGDKAKGKTVEDLLAEDKAKAAELAKSMPLSCTVNDAVLAAEGPATINGKEVKTHTYEVACGNGLGYFLVAVDGGTPYGFSCLAAEATRQADLAAGRKPGTVCGLGANANVENMATNALMHAGISCMANKLRYVGTSSKANLEYNEVACLDGKGYMLVSALPGSTRPVQAITCHNAAEAGLMCKLTASGAPLVTKQTLIDALAANKVKCSTSIDKMNVIGQENTKKRYVVEFSCPEQPKGLVAFIPLEGSKSPFEAIDCKAAAKRNAVCKLTH